MEGWRSCGNTSIACANLGADRGVTHDGDYHDGDTPTAPAILSTTDGELGDVAMVIRQATGLMNSVLD